MGVISTIKAVLVRLIFAIHSLIAIWRVTDVLQDSKYWLLATGLVLLIIEGFVTIVKRKGDEWKWFCPSFFLYLLSVVPAIWFLESDKLRRFRDARDGMNATGSVSGSLVGLSGIPGMRDLVIPVKLSPDMWVQALEQLLLLLLILGRWLLPKGEITRDQLSQLLFVYMGMASDIMEILVLFSEDAVLGDDVLSYVVLSVWSFSLLQFTIVLTATRARKPRVAHAPAGTADVKFKNGGHWKFFETEIWSIMTTIIMQDGPFLIVRMYSMIYHKIFNYTVLFFTCKNALIMSLQIYRIMVISTQDDDNDEDDWQKIHEPSVNSVEETALENVQSSSKSLKKFGSDDGITNKAFQDA